MPDEDFTELVSARLVLRRLQPGDVAELVRYRSDPQVARFQGWEAPYPPADAERLVDAMLARHPDTPGEWFQYAVELRSAQGIIGDCGVLTDAGEPRRAEIGFTIAAAHQGRGYATEAVRTLLGYLFGSLGKHRVSAECDARNLASARVLEKAGMRLEGHLRESTWAKGEWTDDLLYAILHREWAAQSWAGRRGSGPAS
jgi:RimJ/RimL family protein N-acetyltransferase